MFGGYLEYCYFIEPQEIYFLKWGMGIFIFEEKIVHSGVLGMISAL